MSEPTISIEEVSDHRPSLPRRLVRVTVIGVLAFLWAVTVAEAFLRILNPVPVVPRHVIALPFGIRGNEANKRYTHTSADFTIEIRINAQGMRADEDVTYAKPDGVKRIVVLGDSFGMGYEVSLEDTFTSQLERLLNESGQRVEVLNLSVSGHGTSEQLRMLLNEGLKYDPDLVLLAWHVTDYADNVRSGFYEFGDDGRLTDTGWAFLPGVSAREQMESIPGMTLVTDRSMLFWFLREWVSTNVAKPALAAMRNRSDAPEADDPGDDEQGDESGARNRSPEAFAGTPYAMDLSVAILDELERVCDEAGANLLILDIPIRLERTKFKSLFPLRQAKAVLHSPILSPVEAFHGSAGRLIFWERSQRHFTPYGCGLVARELASVIRADRLLDLSQSPQGGE